MKFVLEIELGAAAVTSDTDVAERLLAVAERLTNEDSGGRPSLRCAPLLDFNGTTVGR